MHILTENISKMVIDRLTCLFQSNMKLHMGFRLLYLDLTLAHSKLIKNISAVNITWDFD